jgi:predicted enzyme related to lactoylglutathione lyase
MSDMPQPGLVGWVDLTVDNAPEIRDFYRAVVGWEYSEVPMEDGAYSDYSMVSPEGQPVTGICHNRGFNEGLPPVWLVYFTVENLDLAVSEAQARGGTLLRAPFEMEAGSYAVIRDPAGAICALFQARA